MKFKIEKIIQTWNNLRTWVKLIPLVLVSVLILINLTKGSEQPKVEISKDFGNPNEAVRSEATLTNFEDAPQRPQDIPTGDNGLVFDDETLFAFSETAVLSEQAKEFIERFLNTAIAEKHKFKIPISITLAQGIIESNYGKSKLAKNHNNFFGIKCKIKCKDCDGKGNKMTSECVNFNDDAKDDYFRRFSSAWESFRARSILLSSKPRYESLFALNPNDHVGWCVGLKRCGYATHPKYDKILQNLIKKLNLDKFDNIDVLELAKQRGIYDKVVGEK